MTQGFDSCLRSNDLETSPCKGSILLQWASVVKPQEISCLTQALDGSSIPRESIQVLHVFDCICMYLWDVSRDGKIQIQIHLQSYKDTLIDHVLILQPSQFVFSSTCLTTKGWIIPGNHMLAIQQHLLWQQKDTLKPLVFLNGHNTIHFRFPCGSSLF